MSICNLDNNKELANAIANYINGEIIDNLKTEKPFLLLQIMKDIYAFNFETTKDPNQALGIAGAVPQMFFKVLELKPKYLTQLTAKGFKLDPITAFNKEIETSDKPLEVVGRYIKGVSAPTVAKTIQNSVSVESAVKPLNKAAKNVPVYQDRKLVKDTFKATTISSTIKGTGELKIDQNNPDMVVTQSTVGQLLMAQKDQKTFEDIEYNGHKGFRLLAVREGSLPDPQKNVYSTNKDSNTIVLAVTDNQGNFLYFDKDGKITTEDKGKIAYQSLPVADKTSIDKMVDVAMEQAEPGLREKTKGDPDAFRTEQLEQKKFFTKRFTAEAKYINDIKEKVRAGEKVLVNITGGKVGSIDDRNTKVTLSEIDLDDNEIASLGVTFTPHPTIRFRNYDQLVTLKGLKLKDSTPDLLKSLVDLLVDDLVKPDDTIVSPQEKIGLYKQYVYAREKDTKANQLLLSLGDNKLNIYIGDKFISLEDKEQAKKDLTQFLEATAYHTYIKTLRNTYDSFNIDNGVLTVKTEPNYKAFISKYLVPRIMVDIESKRPMVNNGYFTFEELDQAEVVDKKAKEIVVEAKEELKKSYKRPDLLERSKLIESRASEAQKLVGDKWINETAILKVKVDGKPVLTSEDARNIVNSDAFATFARATMTLYKGGDSTHMYHEAWHAFSQIYLTKAERDKLYTDASKINQSFTYIKKIQGPGGNTIEKVTVNLNTLNPNNPTDRKILEEFIAEEFRIYAMNNGKFVNKKAFAFKDIFKKIWELLKALFKGTLPVNVYSTPGSDVFSEMFSALYNAKKASDLNMFQPSIQNAEFGTLNTGIVNTMSELELDLISRSMDGIISKTTTAYIVEDKKLGAAMQIFNPKNLDGLYNVTIKEALSDRLKELVDKVNANRDKWNKIELDYHLNNVDVLQKALDNFGDIKTVLNNRTKDNSVTAYHLKNSAFKSRIIEAQQDPTDISETDANAIMARNDKSANDIESEKLATSSALYIIQSLIQQEYNPGKTQVNDKLNQLGFPQTIEFKPFWNFLMGKIGGQQNEIDLYNKLVEIKNKKITPLIQQLLDKIGNPAEVMVSNKVAADIWFGLVGSTNLTRIDFINNIFENNKDQDGVETVTAVSGKVSADYHNIKNNIWKNKFNLEVGPFITVNSDKQNELNLEAIGKAFLTSPTNYREAYLDNELILRYRLKEGQDPIAFLNAIGLYMSNDYEVRDAITPTMIDYIADTIGQAWFNKVTITDPIKFLSTKHPIKVQRLIDKKLEVITTNNKHEQFMTESQASLINDLALIEAEFSTEYSSQTKDLPSGDKKVIYSLNSTATRTRNPINKATNDKELDDTDGNYGIVPQWNYTKNPTVMGSIFKSSLFDDTGTRIKDSSIVIGELVGSQFKIVKGLTEGLSHGEMTSNEKFVGDLHSMLFNGFMEPVRTGEGGTYLGMRPNNIITLANYKKKANHLFFDTEHFVLNAQGRSIMGVRVDDYLKQVMYKKLEGELRRIQKIKNGITESEAISLGLDPSEAKDFYKNHVKGFENGFKFDWFDEVLESAEHGGALKEDLINIYADQLNTSNDLSGLLLLTAEGKLLKKAIDTQILSYFENLANDCKKNYEKVFGNTIPDFLKTLVTKNLNEFQKTQVTDQSAINALMMSFAVNSALYIDENILMIYGDGFQSNHTKDEFTKRAKTYISPGKVFSTGQYSLAAINQHYPREYEKKLIADGVITTRTAPRTFDKIGQKAIIKDPVVETLMYNQYKDLLYKVLKERDYTEDQVKELLYGTGDEFAPAKDSIMHTWKNITMADGQGYISFDYYRMLKANENNWTNAQDALYKKEIRGEYISAEEVFDAFPVYKLQYSGPLAVEGTIYPIQSIDKFSLLPLIPSLIKNTPLDTVHKQMISQGADYILFDSGAKRSYIKSGKNNGDEIFEGNDTSKLIPGFKFTLNPYYVDFLKNQTEVSREFKDETRLSTQFRKLFDTGLYEKGLPIDYKGTKTEWDALSKPEKKKESEVYKKTESVLDELDRLTQYLRKDLLTEMGWEEKDGKLQSLKGGEDLTTMLAYIKGKMQEQGYSKHEIKVLETDNGKLDLSTSPIAPRLERFLFSIINNRLVRIKIKGEAFVQVSAAFFGFKNATAKQVAEYKDDDFGLRGYVVDPNGEENTKGVRIKIALTENYENLYNTRYFVNGKKTNQTIAVYNKDNSINHQESFKRLNEMIKDDNWLEYDNNRQKIQITGVRIPVQGLNSTEFAEVWEFLPPSAGPIIIIPREIVAKSGGDFDVDKLTMYIKHIASSGSLLQDTYSTPESMKEKIIELKNRLIELDGTKLDIKNSLNDFRKAITEILGYTEMSKEQVKSFTDKNDKALLETLSNSENQEYLKQVAKKAYKIYEKNIKSFKTEEYDAVMKTITGLYSKDTELANVYKELSDLKEHRRNFTKAIQNTMLDDLIQVLQMPEMAFSLLLPNGTYLAKPYADELQDILREVDNEVDYTKSINTGKKTTGRSVGVSPGVLRNYNYNLKKQQDNMTGKRILGPIVLEIPVHNLLNKAGALLNSEIPEEIIVKGNIEKVITPLTLELKHNFVDTKEAGKTIRRISMSNLLDADKKNQIADVLSQLANGAVDVGKDAWIAYLQGNLEAIPKILFLLETGVPIGEIAYFVNNPLIREYVALKQRTNSKLAKLFYGRNHNKSNTIKKYLNSKLKDIIKLNPEAASNIKTLWGKYNLMKSFIDSTGVKAFDKETLRKVAKGEGTEDQKMAGFLQYLYVEDLTQDHDKLKQAVDVDNNVTGDNAEVQAKLEQIVEAGKLRIYDPSTLKHLREESVLKPFFIQELAADLLGERFFSFRANPVLEKFIRDLTKNPATMNNLKKITGLTKETFTPKFKNALTLHILSNALGEFDPQATEYKGKSVSSLIDLEQVKEDFKNRRYLKSDLSATGYGLRGLWPINQAYLTNYTEKDFIRLTLEREYLRKHIMPLDEVLIESIPFKSAKQTFTKGIKGVIENWDNLTTDVQDKLIYENMLLHQALTNTYNNHELFASGENTVAKKLMDIIKNYPDLSFKYGNLLERFTLDALPASTESKPRRNFKLKANSDISKPEAENYHTLWKELADPNVHKLSSATPEDMLANQQISNFFAELPIYAFLQSGMDPGKFSMNSVMPTDNFKPMMDAATVKFTKEVLNNKDRFKDVLSKFYTLFLVNNNIEHSELKGRGLNYKSTFYESEPIVNIDQNTSQESVNKLEVFVNTLSNLIQQSTEADPAVAKPVKLISDPDIASFQKYLATRKGVFPKEFFTKDSKWLLNNKNNLYDLVDKQTGEIYLKDINLETGYQEIPGKPIMVEEGSVRGELAMQPGNIEQIKQGTKTLTARTYKLEDGVYTLPDGTKVSVKYIGKAAVITEKGMEQLAFVEGNPTAYSPYRELDDFAKAEGFADWADFKKNAKFSENFINGKQTRFIYSVQPAKSADQTIVVSEVETPKKPTPEFDKLPGKSDTPTMTYAGIGSRETPQDVLDVMTKAATYLESLGYTLRSGGAEGADTAFEKGVKSKKQIFKGFDKTGDTEKKIAHEIHPNLQGAMEGSKKRAIAKGKDGERSAKAVENLMARNTNQIFGEKLDTPVDFVLAYDPSGWTGKGPRPVKGGTLQAIDMAARKGIPVINMADPNWRAQLKEVLKNKPAVQPVVQSIILPTDKIIFGHPTIGKSFLKKAGSTDFITLDDDYKDEINKFIDKHRGSKTRQEYKGSKPKEYNDFMVALYDKVKGIAKKEGKKLLVSNTHILKTRMADFDKVINISKAEFKKRLEQRGTFKDYDFEDWKSDIDATIGKVSPEKVITTDKYLSDLLPTQVQSTTEVTEPVTIKASPKVEKKKADTIKSIQDGIKDYRIDEILAVKGYDVQDFISNLEAATTEDEVNQIINKLRDLLC